MKQKQKLSDQRWEQNNYLIDAICPQFKSATYGLVLMTCFRHGRGAGFFRASTKRIAKSAVTSERHVRRILDEFERFQVIELIDEHKGPIPRTYRIRFERINGQLMVNCNIPKVRRKDGKKTTAKNIRV